MSEEPICVASRMRCASPPESVAAARETCDACEAAGAAARAYQCDVADPVTVNACVEAVLNDFGPIWALVNNAGITRDGLLMRMGDDAFDRVLDVNLKGTFNTTRALTKTFMRQRGGCVVNMSSVVGLMGNAGQANYAASKAGVPFLHAAYGFGRIDRPVPSVATFGDLPDAIRRLTPP